MIKKFSVSGFKNFRGKITMNFDDVKSYPFNQELVTDGIINIAVIYGKNAIGKSNFGLALFDIFANFMPSYAFSQDEYYSNYDDTRTPWFEYEFSFGNDHIVYRYEKGFWQEMISEYLELNSEVLMSYDVTKEGFDFSGLVELSPTINLESWKDLERAPILSYFMNNSVLKKTHPLVQMKDFVINMIMFRGHDERVFIGRRRKIYRDFIFDHINEFNSLLKDAEVNIKVRVLEEPDGKKRLYFDTKVPIPFFDVASNGTKALYNFFYWYKTVQKMSLMYIDEFDAFYHFELAETILNLLKKLSQCQKIVTSHNTNLLTNRIMRPDCYFILTRDRLVSVANATERELKEGHNLEKLYKNGEFDEI